MIKSLKDKKNKFCDCFSYFKVVLNTWNIFFGAKSLISTKCMEKYMERATMNLWPPGRKGSVGCEATLVVFFSADVRRTAIKTDGSVDGGE